MIGNLGSVKHTIDLKGRKTSTASPYFNEDYFYDETDNIVAITTNDHNIHYSYDALDQLTSEDENIYVYDTNYNRVEENGIAWTSNELDELLSTGETHCSYDLNGNLLSKKTPTETFSFTYDALDRLIQVNTDKHHIEMIYDPLGRRLSKTVNNTTEHYLYDGENDIGAFTPEGLSLQLRVLGLTYHKNNPSTIAIELGKQVFAPLQDLQGSIRQLVCPSTRKKIAEYDFNAFGKPQNIYETIFNPWRYASKRLDFETDLINFGKRYYDPNLSCWMTTDPAGFIDTMNLYGYVKNNPYRYTDPNGLFAIFLPALFEISFGGIITWITADAVINAVVASALGVGLYEMYEVLNEDHDIAINNETVIEEAETEKKKKEKKSPYSGDQLGNDPTRCPGEGFKWKGRGVPGSGQGAWYNEATQERFFPDLNHPEPIGPHWDYSRGKKTKYEERLFLDGTWGPKL